MYLLGSAAGDRVVMPTHHGFHDPELGPALAAAMDLPNIPVERRGGSAFWMAKA